MTNTDIEKYCILGHDADEFLKKAIERLSLSTRVYFRILRLARTIADLAEALGYRG
jgi:magnesium chelatase family protein